MNLFSQYSRYFDPVKSPDQRDRSCVRIVLCTNENIGLFNPARKGWTPYFFVHNRIKWNNPPFIAVKTTLLAPIPGSDEEVLFGAIEPITPASALSKNEKASVGSFRSAEQDKPDPRADYRPSPLAQQENRAFGTQFSHSHRAWPPQRQTGRALSICFCIIRNEQFLIMQKRTCSE